MNEVGVLDAKTRLSALLDAIEQGGEGVVITRHGHAVATLGPPPSPARRRVSGAELAGSARLLRERMAKEAPALNDLIWEETKELIHR